MFPHHDYPTLAYRASSFALSIALVVMVALPLLVVAARIVA